MRYYKYKVKIISGPLEFEADLGKTEISFSRTKYKIGDIVENYPVEKKVIKVLGFIETGC